MPTYEVTSYGNGRYDVRETTYDDPIDMPLLDSILGVSSIICYVLAFLIMVVMLFSIPATMLFPAIIAVVLFATPALVGLIGKKSIKGALFAMAKYAYLFFNVVVGMWWLLYATQAVSEVLLIGILVVTMYAMYYFPVFLIYDGSQRENKLGIVGTVVSAVLALGVYLTMLALLPEDSDLANYLPILFSTVMTVSGTLFLLTNRLISMTQNGVGAWKRLRLPVIYLVAGALIAVFAFGVIPAGNTERYETAMQCVEQGDYKQARVLLAELGSYKDAAAQLEAIRFVDLQVGEKVTFGNQGNAPDDPYGENPLTWTVVAVEDGKALLFSDAILSSVDSASLWDWDRSNHALRKELGRLEGVFSDEEAARLVPHTCTVENGDGERVEMTNKLFLFSRAELERYCAAAQIFAEEDTSYNDHQVLDYGMSDLDYIYVYAYYVRDTDEEGEWIVADCEADRFVSKSDTYRYTGIRPAVYIDMDEIAK